MAQHVKTAVSLQRDLFQAGEALAGQLHVSRSRLFALALEDFIRRRENRRLLNEINAAYADGPDPQERAYLKAVRRQHLRLLKSER